MCLVMPAEASAPTVDVKTLHAKIGDLTLENDFLEGALSKAGLLSVERGSLAVTICRSRGTPSCSTSAAAASIICHGRHRPVIWP
jgi:hypothetical protein